MSIERQLGWNGEFRGAAMCVLFCANSSVREWVDIPLARAYRQALQLCPTCACGIADASCKNQPLQTSTVMDVEFDEAAQRRVMKRSAWLQAYCHYHVRPARRESSSTSARDWPKALKAVAKAWGCILSLVRRWW